VQVLLDGDGAVAAAGQHLLRKLVLGLGDARARLSRLVLRRVDLGDAGAAALAEVLAGCALLSELDVAEDKIGAAGAAALCAALPAASRLAALDLSHNRFGPAGALALAAALPRCAALGELRIGGVRPGEEGARVLAAALSEVPNGLRLLAIPCTGTGARPAVPPWPWPPRRAAPRAADTRGPFCPGGPPAPTPPAPRAQAVACGALAAGRLQALDLRGCRLAAAGLDALARAACAGAGPRAPSPLSSLTALGLRANELSDAGARVLAEAILPATPGLPSRHVVHSMVWLIRFCWTHLFGVSICETLQFVIFLCFISASPALRPRPAALRPPLPHPHPSRARGARSAAGA
jgi:hypothetical protein